MFGAAEVRAYQLDLIAQHHSLGSKSGRSGAERRPIDGAIFRGPVDTGETPRDCIGRVRFEGARIFSKRRHFLTFLCAIRLSPSRRRFWRYDAISRPLSCEPIDGEARPASTRGVLWGKKRGDMRARNFRARIASEIPGSRLLGRCARLDLDGFGGARGLGGFFDGDVQNALVEMGLNGPIRRCERQGHRPIE